MKAMGTVIGLCGALCWLACPAANPASEGGRPAEAGTGEVVARVLLLKGEPKATAANGFVFSLRPECPLLRTDRLTVPVGGLIVLVLKNNYVLAVDEDQVMPVGSLVMLDEPPAKVPVSEQLANLLRERNISTPERLAGWRQGMVGAETVPVQARQDDQLTEADKEDREPKIADVSAVVTGLRELDQAAENEAYAKEKAPPAPEEKKESKPKEVGTRNTEGAGGKGSGSDRPALKLEKPRATTRMKSALAPSLRIVRWTISFENKVVSKLPGELPDGLRQLLQGPEATACLQDAGEKQKKLLLEIDLLDGAVKKVRSSPEALGKCIETALQKVSLKELGEGERKLSIDIALP
ncbi:MAG: hypothetical protein GYA21_02970 [Myxococcales bacterium]|nr:hypothetical protein [Myxococcales bacterium]